MITGNDISFDLILEDEMVLHYEGTFSRDTQILKGDYNAIDFDESGIWKLSLHH